MCHNFNLQNLSKSLQMLKRFCSSYAKAAQSYLIGKPEWNETFMKYTSKCKVIEAKHGQRIKYEFTVTKESLNSIGIMHEGYMATLLDVCMGLFIYEGKGESAQQSAVTADLSISYLNTVKLGETIVIEANSLKDGKKLRFLEAKVYRKSDDEIVAIGKQTLVYLPKKQNKSE